MPFMDHVKDDKMTRVDGKGLWRSWKRNFKNKLQALLDLIDNSLDASIQEQNRNNFVGFVHVNPDVYAQSGYQKTTGLCITNNCFKSIRPLESVLEVYNSSKVDSGAGDIGENGVGLKQGCATLSDLSFVLAKNGSNGNIELGIVAKALQREEGCYLPAFTFSNEAGDNLEGQMFSLFSQPNHQDVKCCIEQYGQVTYESKLSLEVGVKRLCKHFNDICYGDEYENNRYVFMVILDKIHHSEKEITGRGAQSEPQKTTVTRLMKELREEIPRMYLHIPDSFQFKIGKERAVFKYWPERMVELSTFSVIINKKIPWTDKLEASDGHPDSYSLRIFVGFDGERATDPDGRKEGSLYIYSRQSGRLITHHADARTLLGLGAGGTDFCQSLTIIIDDIGGQLPLNPTKQDVAFGEEIGDGETHKENLFAWVGCIVHFFYNHQKKKMPGSSKAKLTKSINNIAGKDYFMDKERRMIKTLDSSDLTTYDLVFSGVKGKSIRARHHEPERYCHHEHEHTGADTLYRIKEKPKAVKPSANKGGNRRKRKAGDSEVAPIPKLPRRQKQPVSYDESESDGEIDESSEDSELQRKPAARSASPRRRPSSSQQNSEIDEGPKTAAVRLKQPVSYAEQDSESEGEIIESSEDRESKPAARPVAAAGDKNAADKMLASLAAKNKRLTEKNTEYCAKIQSLEKHARSLDDELAKERKQNKKTIGNQKGQLEIQNGEMVLLRANVESMKTEIRQQKALYESMEQQLAIFQYAAK